MPVITTYPYTQYGGLWTPSQQADAKAAGTWPVPPVFPLYSWGDNAFGQLGLGNTTSYSSPKQVGSLTNWLQVACAYNSFVAIKNDGTLWSWGNNASGQLGLNNRTLYSSPKQVGSLTNWSKIACGNDFCLAIKNDGTLWSWGSGLNGKLGLGNTTNYSSPKQVGSLTNWSHVAAGTNHSAAIKTDGTLWTWGKGANGGLGLGNTTSYSSPKQVGLLTNWLIVATSYQMCVALKTDGTLWSWGYNNLGQAGLNNRTYYSSPKQIGALTTWSKVSTGAGTSFALAIKNGELWVWGQNNSGQLGLGNTTNYSSPKQVGSLTNWSSIGIPQADSNFVIKTDGTLWSWGSNNFGQLGLGNTTNQSSPVQIGLLTNWVTVASSGRSAVAIAKV